MRQYTLIPSLPYCCVTSSLESILKKHGYKFNQIEIADFYGLTVPAIDFESVSGKIQNIKISDDVRQIGLHLGDQGLNTFFMSKGLKLKETFISANELSELNFDTVLETIPETSDMLMFFDYGLLFDEERNIGVGHDGIYLGKEGDFIFYLDSGPRRMGVNKVPSDAMLRAMKGAFAGGGISVITEV